MNFSLKLAAIFMILVMKIDCRAAEGPTQLKMNEQHRAEECEYKIDGLGLCEFNANMKIVGHWWVLQDQILQQIFKDKKSEICTDKERKVAFNTYINAAEYYQNHCTQWWATNGICNNLKEVLHEHARIFGWKDEEQKQ